MMPGRTLHRLAARVCSPTTLERIVEPAIADLQKEWAGSPAADASRRLRILLSGYVAILKVMAICALTVSMTTDEERHALVATLIWSFAFTVAATGLLMLPTLSYVERSDISSTYRVQLLPQAVPLAIPIGLTFGIAFGMAGRSVTRATTKALLLAAFAASLASFATLAWVMPAANQAYRETRARAEGHPGPLAKGLSEMTLSELDREKVIAVTSGNARRANRYAWSFHLRFALGAATIVLAGFLFTIAGWGMTSRGLLAFAACLAYWGLIYIGESLSVYRTVLPAYAGAWLPNIVLGAASMLIASSRSTRLRGSFKTAR